jgi:F0F1-type ATP synthase assembly protein I
MSQPPEKRRGYEGLRTAGLLSAIPLLLIVSPILGALIGRWLDGKLGTAPWLLIAGLVMGFVAAGREIYRISVRIQEEERKKR